MSDSDSFISSGSSMMRDKLDFKQNIHRHIDRISQFSNVVQNTQESINVKETRKNQVRNLEIMLKPYHDKAYKEGLDKWEKEHKKPEDREEIQAWEYEFADIKYEELMLLLDRKGLLLEETLSEEIL